MVETFCSKLTLKIRTKMPEIDDERAEVINYGLQLLIGEVPKTIILIVIAYLFGALKLTVVALLALLPYRTVSGGVHLNTHIGCIIATSLFYTGNAIISKYLVIGTNIRYLITFFIWVFAMIMIKLYAPADTEAVPILRKKERQIKKVLSYIIMTISLGISVVINNMVIANILMIGVLFQTTTITRMMYKITGNKFGYEEYIKSSIQNK